MDRNDQPTNRAPDDRAELRELDRQLTRLLVAILHRYEPAARRLRRQHLAEQLRASRIGDDLGSGFSMAQALTACLAGEDRR